MICWKTSPVDVKENNKYQQFMSDIYRYLLSVDRVDPRTDFRDGSWEFSRILPDCGRITRNNDAYVL